MPKAYGFNDFQFTKLIKCGSCGSGITAQEKTKISPDGTVRKYIYYNCTKFHDNHCKEPWIREADLLTQLLLIVDKIDFNRKDLLESIQKEVEKFNKMSQIVFEKAKDNKDLLNNKADVRSYAKYILQEGTREEKQELLKSFKTKFVLRDGKIIIKNK